MDDTAAFLARFPPFDHLPAEEVEAVAGATERASYATGADVLVEDGPPTECLYVVLSGSMELLHEDQVVDILEPGEMFGHPSLLTGLSPTFTVRAHEESVVLTIERSAALRALSRESGIRFVAESLRERMVRAGRTVHGLPELYSTKVGSLVERPPLFLPGSTPVGEAAKAMTDECVPAILVPSSKGVAVVSDADLREHVLAAGFDADVPVSVAAKRRVLSVSADRLAGDAVIEMLDAGVHELAVTDPDGRIIGLVVADQVVDNERSVFTVRRSLLRAGDEDALVSAATRIPQAFQSLRESGLSPSDITRVLSSWSDAVTTRLIDFSLSRHGPAPAAWAWLALGSVARREFTLASDQDNALAYAPSDDIDEVDAWFARFAGEVNAGLARCGFGADAAEVLARNKAWRASLPEWEQAFRDCLEHPVRSRLVRAAVSFDFRQVAGGLDVVPAFTTIIRSAPQHPGFIAALARTATDWRPSLGLRGSLKGSEIDLKKGAVVPVTNVARFHAIRTGITVSSTLDRMAAIQATGALDASDARSLQEAFLIISRLRMEHHSAQIHAGRPVDNIVRLDSLPALVRAELREALRSVAALQKQLGFYRLPPAR